MSDSGDQTWGEFCMILVSYIQSHFLCGESGSGGIKSNLSAWSESLCYSGQTPCIVCKVQCTDMRSQVHHRCFLLRRWSMSLCHWLSTRGSRWLVGNMTPGNFSRGTARHPTSIYSLAASLSLNTGLMHRVKGAGWGRSSFRQLGALEEAADSRPSPLCWTQAFRKSQ